jgi:5-methylcytosine-specific restriction endonuclease McrA
MSSGIRSRFYRSKEWEECRAAYLRSVGGLCEICLSRGLIVPAEIVHHKVHLDDDKVNDPEIALSFDNLQAVCRKCHGDLHRSVSPRRYWINDDGSVDDRGF